MDTENNNYKSFPDILAEMDAPTYPSPVAGDAVRFEVIRQMAMATDVLQETKLTHWTRPTDIGVPCITRYNVPGDIFEPGNGTNVNTVSTNSYNPGLVDLCRDVTTPFCVRFPVAPMALGDNADTFNKAETLDEDEFNKTTTLYQRFEFAYYDYANPKEGEVYAIAQGGSTEIPDTKELYLFSYDDNLGVAVMDDDWKEAREKERYYLSVKGRRPILHTTYVQRGAPYTEDTVLKDNFTEERKLSELIPEYKINTNVNYSDRSLAAEHVAFNLIESKRHQLYKWWPQHSHYTDKSTVSSELFMFVVPGDEGDDVSDLELMNCESYVRVCNTLSEDHLCFNGNGNGLSGLYPIVRAEGGYRPYKAVNARLHEWNNYYSNATDANGNLYTVTGEHLGITLSNIGWERLNPEYVQYVSDDWVKYTPPTLCTCCSAIEFPVISCEAGVLHPSEAMKDAEAKDTYPTTVYDANLFRPDYPGAYSKPFKKFLPDMCTDLYHKVLTVCGKSIMELTRDAIGAEDPAGYEAVSHYEVWHMTRNPGFSELVEGYRTATLEENLVQLNVSRSESGIDITSLIDHEGVRIVMPFKEDSAGVIESDLRFLFYTDKFINSNTGSQLQSKLKDAGEWPYMVAVDTSVNPVKQYDLVVFPEAEFDNYDWQPKRAKYDISHDKLGTPKSLGAYTWIRVTPMLFSGERLKDDVSEEWTSDDIEHILHFVWAPTAIVSPMRGKLQPAIRKRWYDMILYKLKYITGQYGTPYENLVSDDSEERGPVGYNIPIIIPEDEDSRLMWSGTIDFIRDGYPSWIPETHYTQNSSWYSVCPFGTTWGYEVESQLEKYDSSCSTWQAEGLGWIPYYQDDDGISEVKTPPWVSGYTPRSNFYGEKFFDMYISSSNFNGISLSDSYSSGYIANTPRPDQSSNELSTNEYRGGFAEPDRGYNRCTALCAKEFFLPPWHGGGGSSICTVKEHSDDTENNMYTAYAYTVKALATLGASLHKYKVIECVDDLGILPVNEWKACAAGMKEVAVVTSFVSGCQPDFIAFSDVDKYYLHRDDDDSNISVVEDDDDKADASEGKTFPYRGYRAYPYRFDKFFKGSDITSGSEESDAKGTLTRNNGGSDSYRWPDVLMGDIEDLVDRNGSAVGNTKTFYPIYQDATGNQFSLWEALISRVDTPALKPSIFISLYATIAEYTPTGASEPIKYGQLAGRMTSEVIDEAILSPDCAMYIYLWEGEYNIYIESAGTNAHMLIHGLPGGTVELSGAEWKPQYGPVNSTTEVTACKTLNVTAAGFYRISQLWSNSDAGVGADDSTVLNIVLTDIPANSSDPDGVGPTINTYRGRGTNRPTAASARPPLAWYNNYEYGGLVDDENRPYRSRMFLADYDGTAQPATYMPQIFIITANEFAGTNHTIVEDCSPCDIIDPENIPETGICPIVASLDNSTGDQLAYDSETIDPLSWPTESKANITLVPGACPQYAEDLVPSPFIQGMAWGTYLIPQAYSVTLKITVTGDISRYTIPANTYKFVCGADEGTLEAIYINETTTSEVIAAGHESGYIAIYPWYGPLYGYMQDLAAETKIARPDANGNFELEWDIVIDRFYDANGTDEWWGNSRLIVGLSLAGVPYGDTFVAADGNSAAVDIMNEEGSVLLYNLLKSRWTVEDTNLTVTVEIVNPSTDTSE